MTADPTTVKNSSSVEEAAELMRAEDIGDVLVVDRNQKLTGIVTDRDIVVRAVAGGGDVKKLRVDEVYSKDVKSVSPDSSVEDAVTMMHQEAIRRIPVVEDGKLVGIVSLGDLAVDLDPTSALAGISAAAPDTNGAVSNGRSTASELGRALPAVAFGAGLALAMHQVRGRSRRKTVKIAAKKLRKAGKKLRKTGDDVGAEAASKAAAYVAKASKEIRKSGKKIMKEGAELAEQTGSKVSGKLSDGKGKIKADIGERRARAKKVAEEKVAAAKAS
jgi:predicted transcriptional regulator